MLSVFAGYAVGLLQGVRHAFEPDHVAAISTVVARGQPVRASVRFALVWGAGHAATLVIVGSILRAFRASLPQALGAGFELAVAAMLVLLGGRAILHARRHTSSERRPSAGPPLLIGLVHGLALMSLLWAFDLPAVARRNLYLDRLRATESLWDVQLAIEAFRATVTTRPRQTIPH
jgi:hypothetical protein